MRGVTVNDKEIVNIIASECFEAFYPALNERMTPSHKATIYKAAKEKALIAMRTIRKQESIPDKLLGNLGSEKEQTE